jgi:hypothetical protein
MNFSDHDKKSLDGRSFMSLNKSKRFDLIRFSLNNKKQIWKFPRPEEIRMAKHKSSFSVQNEKSKTNDDFDKDHKSLLNERHGNKSKYFSFFDWQIKKVISKEREVFRRNL